MKKILNSIIKTIGLLNNEVQLILISLILMFSVAFYFWPLFISTEYYKISYLFLQNFICNVTLAISEILGYQIDYNNIVNSFEYKSITQKIVFPLYSFKVLLITLPLLLIVYKNVVSNFCFQIFVFLFFIFRSSFITLILLLHKNDIHAVLLVLLDNIRIFPYIILIIYIIRNSNLLQKTYSLINKRFELILSVSIIKLILILFIIAPLPRVIITYLEVDILNWLSNFTLHISKIIMSIFNFQTKIIGNTISIDNYWIHLGHGCIGLGMITILYILIFSMKGIIINKIVYSIILFVVLTFFNALRINMLLLYFKLGWNHTISNANIHTYSNYFIYFIGFIVFIGYVFWFNELIIKNYFKVNKK